jgi:hypothetical protein
MAKKTSAEQEPVHRHKNKTATGGEPLEKKLWKEQTNCVRTWMLRNTSMWY